MNKNNENALKGKVSYGLTDAGGNVLYSFISMYIVYFYTDNFGLSATAAGMMLFVTHTIDAVTAPLWGSLIDKTKTKWGQSRPYFLWLAIPFSFFTVMAFWDVGITGTGRIVYSYVVLLVLLLCYSGLQTAITAILSNLTNNPDGRIQLNTARMIGGNIGGYGIMIAAMPMVLLLGQGNEKNGFLYTAIICAIISAFCFFTAFINLKETTKTEPVSFLKGFKALKGNIPWILLVITNLLFWVGFNMRNATLMYYLSYNMDNKEFVASANFLMMTSIIATIFLPVILKFVSKPKALCIGLLLMVAGELIIYLSGTSIIGFSVGWVLNSFGVSISVAMPFLMLSDTVDFGYKKTGIRAAGLISAVGASFCIKFGSGLGNFFVGEIMSGYNYVPNAVQSTESLQGISLCFIWLPAMFCLLALIPMFFYTKQLMGITSATPHIMEKA